MQALSDTGTTYESWDELVAAEANGWVVTQVFMKADGQVWPWTHGPFATKAEARKYASRVRNRKPSGDTPFEGTMKVFVRPLWKVER